MHRDGDLELVPARADDAAAVCDLVRAAYRPYVDRIGREPAPMTADHRRIAASGRALVVRGDEGLVAVLVMDLDDQALLIESIAVHPDAQGRGVGGLLLARVEVLAREAGRSRIRLCTNAAMTENLRFYRRRGFVETDRREQDGFDRVFFEKVLDGSAS